MDLRNFGNFNRTVAYMRPIGTAYNDIFKRGVLESSWTVIVVTASVKQDEKGGQGHTSESLLHQSGT
jgi:hypothetical protein